MSSLLLKIFFFTTVIVLIVSCTEKKKYENAEIINLKNIDSLKVESNIPISRFFNKGRAIVLESNKESLIGNINKLVATSDRLYIQDRMSNAVLVFDATGKFIFKIRNIGKGDGKYLGLADFTLDETRKEIVLLAHRPSKICIYDYSGRFLREIINEKTYSNIRLSDNSYCLTNYNCNYTIMDISSCKTKLLHLDANIRTRPLLIGNELILSRNLYYTPNFNHYAYEVIANDIFAKYFFDFGKNITNDMMEEIDTLDAPNILSYCVKKNLYCGISDLREYKNILMFNTYPLKKIIYDKREKKALEWRSFFDIDLNLILSARIAHDGNDEKVYFYINAAQFINYYNNIKGSISKSKQIEGIIKHLGEESNPILFEYTLK